MYKEFPLMLLTDYYKTIHYSIYPKGLDYITSYWTPRSNKYYKYGDKIVMFGLQPFIMDYLEGFKENFFNRNTDDLINEYKRILFNTFDCTYDIANKIVQLKNLGYLPLRISAVKEGELVPFGCPMVEITNTKPGFAWLVNYIESIMSCSIWHPMTSATIAYDLRKLANKYYNLTCDKSKAKSAMGDFSFRGQTSLISAMESSAGFLTSFNRTATIPANLYIEKYYSGNVENEELGLGSPSTEHSVMCAYGEDNELECYENILNLYKNGNISIVSDSYDYWNVVNNLVRNNLKDKILNRNGKILIRGDSGDPVKIICGDIEADNEIEKKGTVELLYDIFGGNINNKGYIELDSHIGCIYGDGITYERAKNIYKNLMKKGFAANNVSLGIGSYTLQYCTRDTLGFAMKATNMVINGENKKIFKNPKTDKDKFKKSHKGICHVKYDENHNIIYSDNHDIYYDKLAKDNAFITVYEDGNIITKYTFDEIRKRLGYYE